MFMGCNDVPDVSLTGTTVSSPPVYNLGVKEGARKACCNRDSNIADQERSNCEKVAYGENHVDIKEPCHRKTRKNRDTDPVSKDIWSEKENDDLKNGKDVKLGKDLLSQVEHLSLERNQEKDVDKEIASLRRTRLTSILSLESGLSKEPKSLTDHEQLLEVNTKTVEVFVGKDPDSTFDLNQKLEVKECDNVVDVNYVPEEMNHTWEAQEADKEISIYSFRMSEIKQGSRDSTLAKNIKMKNKFFSESSISEGPDISIQNSPKSM
jgi:hypothetical protein